MALTHQNWTLETWILYTFQEAAIIMKSDNTKNTNKKPERFSYLLDGQWIHTVTG